MVCVGAHLKYRLEIAYLRSSAHRLQGPSFIYKQLEAIRLRKSMRELGCKDPAFEIDAKDDAHVWADALGVRTPQLLGRFEDVHQIDWIAAPEKFVLKPTKGSASTGVYLLSRRDKRWWNAVTQCSLSHADIVRDIESLAQSHQMSASLIMEELIEDPRCPGGQPIDYKVGMFFGRVGLIEAKAHRVDAQGRVRAGWRNFDPSWRDIGNVYAEFDLDQTVPPPIHREELLDIARRVSASIPRPYLRVDLLDDEKGPILGEVTPEPGGEYLPHPRMDRLLGRYWEDAEARLSVRAARAGSLHPTDEPIGEALNLQPLPARP